MQMRHVPNGRRDFTPRQSDFCHVNDRGSRHVCARNGALGAVLLVLLFNEGASPSLGAPKPSPSDGNGEARLSKHEVGECTRLRRCLQGEGEGLGCLRGWPRGRNLAQGTPRAPLTHSWPQFALRYQEGGR